MVYSIALYSVQWYKVRFVFLNVHSIRSLIVQPSSPLSQAMFLIYVSDNLVEQNSKLFA